MSLVDCIFRGVRATELLEASGAILFRIAKIEPAEKGDSFHAMMSWAEKSGRAFRLEELPGLIG